MSIVSEYPSELQMLIEYSRLVYDRHLTSAAGGNISVRAGENILITASGVSLGRVSASDVILCASDGEILAGKKGLRPSKETPFHLNVYRSRARAGAVIHAHPNAATAFSLFCEPLPLFTESAKLKLREVPIIPDAVPGSRELASLVRTAVAEEHPEAFAFLMQAHGVLTFGSGLEEAFNAAELVEDSAKIALLYRLMNQ